MTAADTTGRGISSGFEYLPWLKRGLFVVALYPLARLVFLGVTDDLGANPIEFITRSTGTWTLVFLLITLSVTPLRRLTGWHAAIRLRRMFGLYAFFYASLHFLTYIWLDQFFDLESIYNDVIERPFITVSFPSYVLMIPLAVTSTNAMVRRLGGKRWQLLHRLVYAIAIGGVIHYWWLVKKDVTDPMIYAAILAALLGYRIAVAVRKRLDGAAAKPPATGG